MGGVALAMDDDLAGASFATVLVLWGLGIGSAKLGEAQRRGKGGVVLMQRPARASVADDLGEGGSCWGNGSAFEWKTTTGRRRRILTWRDT